MNKMLHIFVILLAASWVFLKTINYMAENIEDFESVPLPPKKIQKLTTNNPVLRIDATSRKTWTLLNFSDKKTFKVKEPEDEADTLKSLPWDLGFQRTKIITNGGITNPDGIVGVVNLGPVDFDSVAEAPGGGYLQDTSSYGTIINKGIASWYNYRTRTHNIESQKNVYVVRRNDGNYMKLRFLNYYCAREENDCRTALCSREESACLTVEYVLSQEGARTFPLTPPSQIARNTAPDVP